jgi:hypothetical protein
MTAAHLETIVFDAAYGTFGAPVSYQRASGGAPLSIVALDRTQGKQIPLHNGQVITLDPGWTVRAADVEQPAEGDLITANGRTWRVVSYQAATTGGVGTGEWLLTVNLEEPTP